MHDPTCHIKERKALYTAIWIAFFFMIIEVIGGYLANSLALISDALHLFTDVAALSLGIFVSYLVKKPATPIMSYGYHRAEIIGALASAASLFALAGVLTYEAILRLITPPPVEGPLVFAVASFGLIANFSMMKVLHPTRGHNLNMKTAYLHVIGDLLGSVGVIISGLLIWLTGWNPIDAITTILFTAAILKSAWDIVRSTIAVLMESTPPGIDPIAIEAGLKEIEGVREIHDLHIWAVSTNKIAMSAHVVADHKKNVLADVHEFLEKKHKIRHMTIQIEDPRSFEPKYCYDCQNGVD